MSRQFKGLKEIKGPLIILDDVQDVAFEEVVEIELEDGTTRFGRVVEIEGNRAVIQVFEGTTGLSKNNTKTRLLGHPMEISVSKEILGRTFNGSGTAIDGLGKVYAKTRLDINGRSLNPVMRKYPRDYINTGISAIDGLNTLIRGQKLPIFSGSGMTHNQLAVQIVRQANIASTNGQDFAIVFAAMGVKHDVANFFKKSFEETGVMEKVVMFLNLSNDPIIERILTPRCALTVAEYLAFEEDMHVLVIMTDVTAYCEALREFSSSKEEIPGRKGYPGYLYSDLASLYERAGLVEGKLGSVTQIPILTIPNDDITHPVSDLTGYITEGQIVLDRNLHQTNIYPPIGILPSLSRLMKDGIGEGYTRKDHSSLSTQLFACYAKVQDARALASVIGEEELSTTDRKYMAFGRYFEKYYIGQGFDTNRSMEETLNLGWTLLSLLPKAELDRISSDLIAQYHDTEQAIAHFMVLEQGKLEEILRKG
jgi:V/A-type H+-transporting ATPase subunit B